MKHLNQQESHPPVSSMVPKESIMEEKAAEITAATISLSQINAGIKKIETQLSVYSDLSYDQFSDSQLLDFNSLMQKKAVLLKTAIFRKHGQL